MQWIATAPSSFLCCYLPIDDQSGLGGFLSLKMITLCHATMFLKGKEKCASVRLNLLVNYTDGKPDKYLCMHHLAKRFD
jgi:hypothetical protein